MTINSLKPRPQRFSRCKKMMWECFGKRRYARNSRDGSSVARMVFWWMAAAFGVVVFVYFPLKVMSLVFMLGLVSWGLTDAIRCANTAIGLGVMNLLLGVAGLLWHWHFGVTFFGHHFEFVLLWGFVVSGVLALLRRFWNALIWRLLDATGYHGVL